MLRRSLIASAGALVALPTVGYLVQGEDPTPSESITSYDTLLIIRNQEWLATTEQDYGDPQSITIESHDDADEYIDLDALDPEEATFIDNTDFETQYLVICEHPATNGVLLSDHSVTHYEDGVLELSIREDDTRTAENAYIDVMELNSFVFRFSREEVPFPDQIEGSLRMLDGTKLTIDTYEPL